MPISRRTAVAALATTAGAAGAAAPALRERERVRVLATTDRPLAQGLIDGFEARHPAFSVDYVELGSAELYERASARGAAPGTAADVLWSSAMDLQIKLVNDGFAARHVSEHADQLPRWAIWKHEAYGTSYEPVGLVVRRELLGGPQSQQLPPRTHAALAEWLQAERHRLRGRVATYDIARAGLGYLLAAQDTIASAQHWQLLRALGACATSLHADTAGMLEQVAAGRALLAYNVLGSYAEAFIRRHPELELIYFQDYTLVASRVAFVAREAPQARGARLWLDHLLSHEGQRALARSGGLYPIRALAPEGGSLLPLAPRLGPALRPITLGPGLLAHLDQSKRESLLRRWRAAITATPAS